MTPVISVEDDADGVAHLEFFHCIEHTYFGWFVKWKDIYKINDNVCHIIQNRWYHDCHKDWGNCESNACHREFKPRGGDHPCFRPLCSCSCPFFPLCSWFRPLFPYLFLFVFAFVLILFALSRPLISKTNAKTQKRIYHTEQTRYLWLLLWSTQCTRANCGSPLSKIRDNLEADGSHTNSKIQNDMHQIWNWQIG